MVSSLWEICFTYSSCVTISNTVPSYNSLLPATLINISTDDGDDEKIIKINQVPHRDFCLQLVNKIKNASDLPISCLAHLDVKAELQRKNSKHDYAIAFEGMPPGEAAAAMAARDKGMMHHAQIQRRMTNSHYKRSR